MLLPRCVTVNHFGAELLRITLRSQLQIFLNRIRELATLRPTRRRLAPTDDTFSINKNIGGICPDFEGMRDMMIAVEILGPNHLVLFNELTPFFFDVIIADADHFELRFFRKPLL